MTAQRSNETSTSCGTCRGWSCMKCVRAIDHERCAMDCPDCYDTRNLPEQEWIPASDLRALAFDRGQVAEGRVERRTHRAQGGWQAHRIHRLQARCAG